MNCDSSISTKARYMQLLLRDFHALEAMINGNRLESGIRRFGYELELNFLNQKLEPLGIGVEVRDALNEQFFTTEFSRFNLEINSDPVALGGRCFAGVRAELDLALNRIKEAARAYNGNILLTGIIPTLTPAHITPDALTPEPRYRALYQLRRELKGEQYEYRINGIDELLSRDNISLYAGCVTSFQVHLQIDAQDTVDNYNWAQLIAAPVLACATNSPLFLGKRLWHETRVALFEQATDTRNPAVDLPRNRARVSFGDHWLQNSALEVLQEDIVNFNALFTLDEVEDPWLALESGEVPRLEAWNKFNGSIYRWNRLCYGRGKDKPSLRIENRVLPSGPTVPDMVANAVFWVGLMAGLPEACRSLQNRMAFEDVKHNFFNAARLGLDASIKWADGTSVTASELILDELLPLAREGLEKLGIDEADAIQNLDIIATRTQSGQTGSVWMLNSYTKLSQVAKRDDALQILTAGMLKRQESDRPVHTWSPVHINEGGDCHSRYDCVHKIMSTNLYKVSVDDVLDLVTHIMEWKRVGHIPVENAEGKLVGLITRDTIINFMVNAKDRSAPTSVGELMLKDPMTVTPETTLKDAVCMLLEHKLSCLPVAIDGRVVGIVTERDLVEVTKGLISEVDIRVAQ